MLSVFAVFGFDMYALRLCLNQMYILIKLIFIYHSLSSDSFQYKCVIHFGNILIQLLDYWKLENMTKEAWSMTTFILLIFLLME